MELPDEWKFLGRLRFWSMVLAATMLYLQRKGWIGEPEALLIGGLSAAFWTTQTIDRFAEKIGKTEVEAKEEIKEEKEK
jgi:hypothetical protein